MDPKKLTDVEKMIGLVIAETKKKLEELELKTKKELERLLKELEEIAVRHSAVRSKGIDDLKILKKGGNR